MTCQKIKTKTMKQVIVCFAFLHLALWSIGQDTKEFACRIYYTIHFNIKSAKDDYIQLIRFFAITNVYSYKKGNYLWTFDGDMKSELYLHEKGLLLNKYRNQAYYISRDVVNEKDNVIDYSIKEN